jgi:hypothetical protein
MSSAAPSATPLVSARGISKQFGGVEVLTDVDGSAPLGPAFVQMKGTGGGLAAGTLRVRCG